MKKLIAIFRLTLLSAFILMAACEKPVEPVEPGTEKPDPDPDPEPDPEPVVFGTLTHDGETRDILRATFNYTGNGEGQASTSRIILSPVEKEEGLTLELIEIEIHDVFLGKEWDLSSGTLPGQLAIRYRKDFNYYQPYLAYLNDGDGDGYSDIDLRKGTIKVSREEGNVYDVQIKDMELQDGTTLSCSAKGVFQERLDPFMDGRIKGTPDYKWVIRPNYYRGYDGGTINMATAELRMDRAYTLQDAGKEALTYMEITGVSEDGDSDYTFKFIVKHQNPQLVSQKYEIVIIESDFGNVVDYENSTLTDVHFNLNMYHAPTDVVFYRYDNAGITQGDLTLEVREHYLKVTMPGNFDEQYELQPAEFVFDLTNAN